MTVRLWTDKDRETRRAYLSRPEVKARRRQYEYDRRRRDTISTLLTHARKRARQIGVECTITREDISIPDFCPALGIGLVVGDGTIHDNSPTVDRINPRLGYVPGNVQVLSWRANRIKSNATPEELAMVAKFMEELCKTA